MQLAFGRIVAGRRRCHRFLLPEDCQRNESTTLDEQDGDAVYRGLAVRNPGARSNGTVVAESQEQAEEMAAEIVNNRHGSAVLRVTIVEPGNRAHADADHRNGQRRTRPVVPFTVDVASEFVWALTAVFACFAIVLLPAFAIYAVSRRRERADEAIGEAEAADVVES